MCEKFGAGHIKCAFAPFFYSGKHGQNHQISPWLIRKNMENTLRHGNKQPTKSAKNRIILAFSAY